MHAMNCQSESEGNKEEQAKTDALFAEALEALTYDDGQRRPTTTRTLNLIDAVFKTGSPNAYILKGIERLLCECEALECLLEAEARGCTHPLLYYYLGTCYWPIGVRSDKNLSKSMAYHTKALGGGLTLSHLEMYKLYGHKPDDHHSHDHKKAHQYLLDVQAEGAVDGLVMCEIALRRGLPIIHNRERDLQQMEYYKQAAMLGCNEGYRLLFHWYWGESKSKKENQDKAIQLLVRGMNERILDDRVLRTLFYAGDVSLYTPGPNVLGQKHSNLSELMLDWIEWFIYRNSSEAYEMKAQLYKYGWDSIPKDESKRVATWLEADKRGLATHQTYLELIMSYMKGHNNLPIDGAKVLEYSDKAMTVANTKRDEATCLRAKFNVYKRGISPIPHDKEKADELFMEAMRVDSLRSQAADLS